MKVFHTPAKKRQRRGGKKKRRGREIKSVVLNACLSSLRTDHLSQFLDVGSDQRTYRLQAERWCSLSVSVCHKHDASAHGKGHLTGLTLLYHQIVFSHTQAIVRMFDALSMVRATPPISGEKVNVWDKQYVRTILARSVCPPQ